MFESISSPVNLMKKILFFSLLVLTAAAVAVAQDLGALSRKERARKRAPATIRLEGDGFSLPESSPSNASTSSDTLSNKDNPNSADAQGSADAGAKADAKDSQGKKGSDAEKQKTDELNTKINAQKREVTLLQRELEIAQREQRMRSALYFNDPAAQSYASAKYVEENRKEQEQIDSKKHALDEAQQKLDELLEQARKSGVRLSQ